MKSTVVVLDFDGVMANSIGKLKLVFKDFLADYGISEAETKFDEFNGKTIMEIIAVLRSEFSLKFTIADLVGDYDSRVANLYLDVDLLPSCREFLELCEWMHIPVAIASANNRTNIEYVLSRFDLSDLVTVIVSSNEVQFGKPHPETYQQIQNYFGNCDYLVVDDSIHGLKGALDSGMQADLILFGLQSSSYGHKNLDNFVQLGIYLSHWRMDKISLTNISSIMIQKTILSLPSVNESQLESHWANLSTNNDFIHNGDFSILWGLRVNELELSCEIQYLEFDYKTFTYYESKLGVPVVSLAVSGVVFQDKSIVVGLRAGWVSQYSNFLELPPSGNLDPSHSPDKQLGIELKEELGVAEGEIIYRNLLGIYFDVFSKSLDFIYEIHISPFAQLKVSSEYDWVKKFGNDEMRDFVKGQRLVPTSRYIIEQLGLT